MISDDTGRDSGHAGRPHKVFLFLSLTTQDTRLDTAPRKIKGGPKWHAFSAASLAARSATRCNQCAPVATHPAHSLSKCRRQQRSRVSTSTHELYLTCTVKRES